MACSDAGPVFVDALYIVAHELSGFCCSDSWSTLRDDKVTLVPPLACQPREADGSSGDLLAEAIIVVDVCCSLYTAPASVAAR